MNISKKLLITGVGAMVLVAGGGAAFAAVKTAAPAPKVTAVQAIDLAQREVPGAWVRDVDYDSRGTWSVELIKAGTEHEIKLDSASGKVLKRETDRAEDDD